MAKETKPRNVSKVEVFEAEDGWRWRAKAKNGRIVADSGKAYTRPYDALEASRKAFPDVEGQRMPGLN